MYNILCFILFYKVKFGDINLDNFNIYKIFPQDFWFFYSFYIVTELIRCDKTSGKRLCPITLPDHVNPFIKL